MSTACCKRSVIWRKPANLVYLPLELIDMIARYLSLSNLLNLRLVRNRKIIEGTDVAWCNKVFGSQDVQMVERAVRRLGGLAQTRFPKYVRGLHIDVSPKEEGHFLLTSETTARKQKDRLLALIGTELAALLEVAINLKKFNLTGPKGTHSSATARIKIIQAILGTLQVSTDSLEAIVVYNMQYSLWHPQHRLTKNILECTGKLPSISTLTMIDLQLNLHWDTPPLGFIALTKVLLSATNLQRLGIRPGTNIEHFFRIGNTHWEPLLELLGVLAKFRLHALCLFGVTTSGNVTVDQIVNLHSTTLRRFVFANTHFRRPNSIRALFVALSKVEVLEYVAFKDFWLHDHCWLAGATISETEVADESLSWRSKKRRSKDESFKDWVIIEYALSSRREWIEWDNEDGKYEKGWIREGMLEVVDMVDCGAIEDA